MNRDMEPLLPLIRELQTLASHELPSPVSLQLTAWADGDYGLHIWHTHEDQEAVGIVSEGISYAVDRGEFVKVTKRVDEDGSKTAELESLGAPEAPVSELPDR